MIVKKVEEPKFSIGDPDLLIFLNENSILIDNKDKPMHAVLQKLLTDSLNFILLDPAVKTLLYWITSLSSDVIGLVRLTSLTLIGSQLGLLDLLIQDIATSCFTSRFRPFFS